MSQRDDRVARRGHPTLPSDPGQLDEEAWRELDSLARFAEENPNPILRVSSAGIISYANSQCDYLLGQWSTNVGGELPASLSALVKHAFASCESVLTREVYADCIYQIHIVPVGHTSSIHLYCADITMREQAQKNVQDLARFPDENPNPILRADKNGLLLYANKSSSRLLGEWSILVGEVLPASLAKQCRDTIVDNVSRQIEHLCSSHVYSLDFFPVPNTDYLNIYARDITARRLAEKDILNTRDEAIQARDDLMRAMLSLEQRNYELSASMLRLDEDAILQQSTLNALDDLCRNFLNPLRSLFDGGNPSPGSFTQICMSLDKTIARVSRLQQASQTKELVANKKVLLAESNTKRRSLGRIALRGLALDLDVASSLEEGMELIAANHYDVFCCSEELVHLCEEAYRLNSADSYVLLSHRSIAETMSMLVAHPYLTSLVANYDDSRHATLRNIATTVQKLATTDFFGVQKYLNWGTEVHALTVSSSEQRGDAVAKMEHHLEEAGIRSSVRTRVGMIAEELLMNAIYDAPTFGGKAKYNHLSRMETIKLQPGEECTLRWGFDGSFLAVSVEDPFGALSRELVLGYLQGCYEGKAGSLNEEQNKGGAGMGLFQIMRSSALVVINVHAGSRTEVISILDLESPMKRTNGSLHFFFDE